MSSSDLVSALLESIGMTNAHGMGEDTARIEIHENRVVGVKLVPGLKVEADEADDGVTVVIKVEPGVRLEKPVHICFGVLPEDGKQHIDLSVRVHENAYASFLAHCTFPNAVDVEHTMAAGIEVEPGAHYAYFERHVHGEHGGITVIPESRIILYDDAEFTTEFELIKGRAGKIKFDYEVLCHDRSVAEMTARINGRADDTIEIHERAQLLGDEARAALVSHIALRDNARADIFNDIIAYGKRSRGHVDCKEIILDNAIAKAIPTVEVHNPTAHVTHEAAIGSVDSKQLQTLLSRGLTEDEATDLIIEGLLSKKARWSSD
jgi:Fe-S cluster assembly scaffold protein SufB